MTDRGAPKKRGFWDQPVVRYAGPGRNYTRFVRSMRILLPLIAACVVGIVMAWPRMQSAVAPIRQQASAAKSASVTGKNELLNPSFKGIDNRNEPYTVTAARAVQSLNERDTIILEKPAAEILLNNGRRVGGEARRGSYAQKEGRLLLEDEVTLHDDEGYVFMTSKLLINLSAKEAWSDQPVWGSGPTGTLEASGVQAYDDKKVLIFTGPAKLVLKHVQGM